MFRNKVPATEYDFLKKVYEYKYADFDYLLEQSGHLAEDYFFDSNRLGDIQGCRIVNGKVRVPEEFHEPFREYSKSGWAGIDRSELYGGSGGSFSAMMYLNEFLSSGNMSLQYLGLLTHAAVTTIKKHASEELQDLYVSKMVTCQWTGAICLTEARCGSDLSLIETTAEKTFDGKYIINGLKSYVAFGDHDLAENIVCLVLAKTQDDKGEDGLSLFLVPKRVAEAEDELRNELNGVKPLSLENTMGVRGIPTCEMEFEGAEGFLIGELNRGVLASLPMMNEARIMVGVQSLGVSEVVNQFAKAYAKQRVQGSKEILGTEFRRQVTISEHIDVKKMVIENDAWIQGIRGMFFRLSMGMDNVQFNGESSDYCKRRVAMFTPVMKAFTSDIAFQIASNSMQIMGGKGYLEGAMVSQFMRDVRVAQIYEGTNGMQALDLMGRNLSDAGKVPLNEFLDRQVKFINKFEENEKWLFKFFIGPFRSAVDKLIDVKNKIEELSEQNLIDEDFMGSSKDFLDLLGYIHVARSWCDQAEYISKLGYNDAKEFKNKVSAGKYFMKKILPHVNILHANILTGNAEVVGYEF